MHTCANNVVKVTMCDITEIEGFRRKLNFTNEDVKSIRVDGKGKERNLIPELQPSTREDCMEKKIPIQLTFWTIQERLSNEPAAPSFQATSKTSKMPTDKKN